MGRKISEVPTRGKPVPLRPNRPASPALPMLRPFGPCAPFPGRSPQGMRKCGGRCLVRCIRARENPMGLAEQDPELQEEARERNGVIPAALRQVWRLIILVVGVTVVAVGVAMIVLPGPAFVVIPAGLGILATEFMWARRLLDRVKRSIDLERFKEFARRG